MSDLGSLGSEEEEEEEEQAKTEEARVEAATKIQKTYRGSVGRSKAASRRTQAIRRFEAKRGTEVFSVDEPVADANIEQESLPSNADAVETEETGSSLEKERTDTAKSYASSGAVSEVWKDRSDTGTSCASAPRSRLRSSHPDISTREAPLAVQRLSVPAVPRRSEVMDTIRRSIRKEAAPHLRASTLQIVQSTLKKGTLDTLDEGSGEDWIDEPTSAMSTPQQAAMHASLHQLAAFLRESKENQNQVTEDSEAYVTELQELRQECKVWEGEAHRLSKRAEELQRQLEQKMQSSPRHTFSPQRQAKGLG